LEQVLGIGQGAEDPVAVHLQLAAVRLDELAERLPVAAPCPGQQLRRHRDILTGAMSAFVRMYQPHEAREDTVVFPAYRNLVGVDELNDLASTFADLEVRQFGAGAFGAVVDHVAEIERSLGIYDLNQFTPPPVPP